MAHALTPDSRVCHLHATTVADNALELCPFVLAATTLIVAFGAEDTLAEQAVFLRAIRAIVDRLGLLNLTEAPASDIGWAGQSNADGAEVVDAVEDVFVHVSCFPWDA